MALWLDVFRRIIILKNMGAYRPLDYAGVQSILNAVVSGEDLARCCEGPGYNVLKVRPIIFPPVAAQAPTGKLPISKIRELRANGWTNKKIARHFKVSEGTIRRAQKHENALISVIPTNGQHPDHPGYYNQQEGTIHDFLDSRQYIKTTKSGTIPDREELLSRVINKRRERTLIILGRIKKRLGGSISLDCAWRFLTEAGNDKDFRWYEYFVKTYYFSKRHKKTIDQVIHEITSDPEKFTFPGSVKF